MRNALMLGAVLLGLIAVADLARADEAGAPAAAASEGASSAWGFTAGLGYATAWGREVNPAYVDLKSSPQLFGMVRFGHYALELEIERPVTRQTSAGGLSITTETMTYGAWGRYAFGAPADWQPFVSAGYGVNVDQVRTAFQNRVDERGGRRTFYGLGAGLDKRFWRFLMGEAEARVTTTEAARGYGFSLIGRLGVTF